MATLISIIIPVYNSEKTLHRCINSILNQTFCDWELLLIDDGSKDKSGIICDEYAVKDKRIKSFHKKNEGVSTARNIGLNNSIGKLVTFVDSDDWVKEKYLENLINHMSDEIDLVISYAEFYNAKGCKKEYYPSKIVTDANFESIFTENDMHWHTSPWSKLFRMDIIRNYNFKFCEGMHIGEDALFLYSYILRSKKIYISSDTDYCYFETSQDSLTKRINILSSELLSYDNINSIINRMIEEKSIKSKNALEKLGWLIAYYQRRILNALYHNNIPFNYRLSILKEKEWNYYIMYINCNSVKERILITLLKNRMFILYDFLRFFSVFIKLIVR